MTETKAIQILIVDDHAVVREGLRTLISTEPGMAVAGEAADGVEAVLQAIALQPDVILLDMLMPRKDGLAAITEIRQNNPNAKILVLTSYDDDQKVISAIKAGALGYLLKDSSPRQLLSAIQDVYEGKSSLHPNIAFKVIQELGRPANRQNAEDILTAREIETLRLIAQGLTNQEIAEELTITQQTAAKHVSNILEKLRLANRTQAALYALKRGLASLE